MPALAPRENPHLFGHAQALAAIQAAAGSGRLHHAWLISGAEGIGKATLAFRFARFLLAGGAGQVAGQVQANTTRAPGGGKPGLEALTRPDLENLLFLPETDPVFRRVAAGTHADLLTVEREWDDKKKRMKKQIAAETARGIPPFLHLTPAEGGWRVVILDGAEDLNAQSANALLKVLEEPPPRAVLILVCNAPGRLLPTIRSRCRHLPLSPLPREAMAQALALYCPSLPAGDRARLSVLAEGSPGRALALAEEDGLAIARLVDEVLHAGGSLRLTRAYEIADTLREQAPFETFMALLYRGVAAAARAAGDATQANLAADLAALTHETERANMDRRQALVTGLARVREGR